MVTLIWKFSCDVPDCTERCQVHGFRYEWEAVDRIRMDGWVETFGEDLKIIHLCKRHADMKRR